MVQYQIADFFEPPTYLPALIDVPSRHGRVKVLKDPLLIHWQGGLSAATTARIYPK